MFSHRCSEPPHLRNSQDVLQLVQQLALVSCVQVHSQGRSQLGHALLRIRAHLLLLLLMAPVLQGMQQTLRTFLVRAYTQLLLLLLGVTNWRQPAVST
jgi:hypothetical protein